MSMAKITHIVVHYSATFEDQNLTRDDIDVMHKVRGWRKVGYHYVIRRDGTVEVGRAEHEVGAHVGGQNTGKIGICCIGGLNRATGPNKGVDNRTPVQTAELIALIRELLKRYPGAEVVGHRDLAATQCPGFDVRTWWAGVQHKPRGLPTLVSPTAPVTTPDVHEDEVHVVEAGDTWFSIAKEHGLSLVALLSLNGASQTDVLRVGRVLDVRRATVGSEAGSAAPPPVQPGFWARLFAYIFNRS